MKKLLFLFFFTSSLSYAQQVSCQDLMDYAKTEGYRKGSVSPISLMDSDWLYNVEAYSVGDVIVVIATIKRDQYGYNKKDYVFCGIPARNWSSFSNGLYSIGTTYGERFHKYIMDYQCDCY